MVALPKVSIEYCARCKWQNRAIWYLQEILQTFGDPEGSFVAEVSVVPSYDQPGLFRVTTTSAEGKEAIVYWRRMKKLDEAQDEAYYFDGFPDSKLLKVLIRNELFPGQQMGHVDGRAGQLTECQPCRDT